MSGKDYVIKYSAMDQLYLLICNRISGWYNELADWSEEYTRLVDMESFQGTSAESAKAYLQEVHGLMICFVQQTLQVFQSRYLLYKNGYYDIDGNIYANIPQEALQDVKKKLRDESEKLQNISDSIDSSVSSVSDLIYLKNPSIFNLKDTMDGLKRELNEFDQKIESYESSELTSVQGEMQGLIDSLQTAIQGYLSNGTNIASYQPGAVAGNTNILDLYQRAMAGSEYVEAHKDEIELAAAEQEEAFAQMQADYEAACEAREAEGQAKLIQGGLAIVIGTIAIVGTAGMATPIVITAGVAGGSAIAYGASTSIEGAQDWYLGSIGDLETAAINPIRDTVFAGNQELYDLWGSLSMTVAGMCVPVGQSINGVAGMGKDVLVKTAIKTIAKETVQDTISDKISGEITEFATEKLNLNEAWSTALNIGIGLGLDKGMDFAGQKIGVSDGPRFTDDMSFDDAKRYNQYWDELEKGIHIDHPGLTRADIDAWNLADAKLNEHIAISKVDTDAVLDLRMKELETQRHFLNGDTGNTANKSGSANQYCLSGEEHFEAFKEMYGAENVEWTSRDTLSSADRLRIKDWKYPPSDDLYIKYKDVYQNDLYYNQATGEINWPANDGFKEGTIIEDTRLPEGTLFKRYGSDNGEFLGTADDSFEARSLAPHSENAEIHYYRMTEEGSMTSGEIAPWFGSEGGGTQFVKYKPDGTKYTIRELEDAGLIEDITDLVEEGVIRIE